MARINPLLEHKSWEDWTVFGLGTAWLLSPIIDETAISPIVVANVVLVGIVLLALAVSELMLPERWDARATIGLGVWMMLAPSIIGYPGNGKLAFWHVLIGALVAMIAALELWQDSHREPN
jgi:xanthine/uracil permease